MAKEIKRYDDAPHKKLYHIDPIVRTGRKSSLLNKRYSHSLPSLGSNAGEEKGSLVAGVFFSNFPLRTRKVSIMSVAL